MLLLTVISIPCLASLVGADTLPEGFYGRFRLGRSDNFDEYLTAKGYGWLTRRIVSFASVDKVFTKTGPTTFDFDNLTTKKDIHYKNIVLGKEFLGEGLDSTKHRASAFITFAMRGNRLYEKHIPTSVNAKQKEDEYGYELVGTGMVQILETKGIVARRYFTRV